MDLGPGWVTIVDPFDGDVLLRAELVGCLRNLVYLGGLFFVRRSDRLDFLGYLLEIGNQRIDHAISSVVAAWSSVALDTS